MKLLVCFASTERESGGKIMPQNNCLPEILAHLRTADGLIVKLRNDPVGVLELPEMENMIIAIHLAAPTRLDCRRGGRRFVGTAVHRGIDIIPDQTPSRWEIFDNKDTASVTVQSRCFWPTVALEKGAVQ